MGKANFVSVKVFQRRLACGISIRGGKALPIETAAGWDTVTDRLGHSLSSSGIQSQPGWDTVMAQVGYSHRLSGIQSQLRCDTVTARWDTVTARMGYSHSPDGVKTKDGKAHTDLSVYRAWLPYLSVDVTL